MIITKDWKLEALVLILRVKSDKSGSTKQSRKKE